MLPGANMYSQRKTTKSTLNIWEVTFGNLVIDVVRETLRALLRG